MNGRSCAFTAAVSLGGVASWASMTLTPPSHDFGQIAMRASSPRQLFQLTGTAPKASRGVLKWHIGGPGAAEFLVDMGWLGPPAPGLNPGRQPFPPGSCLGISWSQTGGSCQYSIIFTPQSLGRKTAQLIVRDPGTGETATAALSGEGILGCRPHLVSCNYADNYSGNITIHTVDSSVVGVPRRFRDETSIKVTITNGVATCSGFQNDYFAGPNNDGTSRGPIAGDGLFAVEFAMDQGNPVYKLKFSCPTANLTHTENDYINKTSSTGATPSDSASSRDLRLVVDPQPTSQIGAYLLIGTQKDLRAPAGDDTGGYSTVDWTLKRQ